MGIINKVLGKKRNYKRKRVYTRKDMTREERHQYNEQMMVRGTTSERYYARKDEEKIRKRR